MMLQDNVYSKFRVISSHIGLVAWTLTLIAYFFQFPFSWLTDWISPCFFVFFLTQIVYIQLPRSKPLRIVILIYIAYLLFEAIRSIVLGVAFGRIVRFGAIMLLIPACCLIKPSAFKKHLHILSSLAELKAILLIAIALNLIVVGDHSAIRAWISSYGSGDIYLLNGLPKVQVPGNALLLVAFMVEYMCNHRFTKRGTLIFIGILCAGNFAFVLGLLGFAFYRFGLYFIPKLREGKINLRRAIILFAICAVFLGGYFTLKIIEKAGVSNAIRQAQIQVLLDTNWLWGRGLGSVIETSNPLISYSGEIYFELQTLYIFNQIGIIGLGLYFMITLYLVYKRGIPKLVVYLLYLFYSFWNPYCFDMTHLISCFAILNILLPGGNDDQGSNYYLFPRQFRREKRNRNTQTNG